MSLRTDTVMRCVYCRSLVLEQDIHTAGGCNDCGSRRLQIAFKLTDEEMDSLVARGYVRDPDHWSDRPNIVED